ncbi:MAG: flagellar export chaperone FlgN [Salinispira sp.]
MHDSLPQKFQFGEDSESIEQRIKLLNRLRQMLEAQREKFHHYLNILEKQEDAIISANTEALENHMHMEHQIIRDIQEIQKIITPIDAMYRKIYPDQKEDIKHLQESLHQLREQALIHNAHNRELLIRHRDEIKQQVDNFRHSRSRKSVYTRSVPARMIDVEC